MAEWLMQLVDARLSHSGQGGRKVIGCRGMRLGLGLRRCGWGHTGEACVQRKVSGRGAVAVVMGVIQATRLGKVFCLVGSGKGIQPQDGVPLVSLKSLTLFKDYAY
jgi:hypothetical protein